MRYINIILICLILLPACAVTVGTRFDSGYDPELTGAKLILPKPLTIHADRASIYIQHGNIVTSGIDKYAPHCKFEVNTIKPTDQTIRPDTFIIHTIKRDELYVQSHAFYYASLDWANAGGSPTAIDYVTEMYLRSSLQPDVLRLTCGHWEDPHDAKHLTAEQIQQTLGHLFELKLADTVQNHST